MLVLGAQVLLGFQYSACFQPGFQRLSALAAALDAMALALMLVVVMLVIAPASFHRIAEKGEDT